LKRIKYEKLPNIHPDDILLNDFLEPLQLSRNALARAIGVYPRRINEICLHKRGITADTALRLARFFGTSKQLWLGLQNDFDLEDAESHIDYLHVHRLEEIRPC